MPERIILTDSGERGVFFLINASILSAHGRIFPPKWVVNLRVYSSVLSVVQVNSSIWRFWTYRQSVIQESPGLLKFRNDFLLVLY